MRAFTVVLALVLLAAPASAQRPSTLTMSCSEAQALVNSRGAVVMSTGEYTYKRFVATVGYCVHGEYAERAWAPTQDERLCAVGSECKPRFIRPPRSGG